MKHPEGDWSRGGGENSARRTATEVQSSPHPTLLDARKACGPLGSARAAVSGGAEPRVAAEQDVNKPTRRRGKGHLRNWGWGERTSHQHPSAAAWPSRPWPGSWFQRSTAARAWTPKAPAHLARGATRPSAPRLRAPSPAAPYLNPQSGSRASRPGAPNPFLLLKSFWNSVGAMLATARPGSLLWALARPPLLEPPRHPHGRLSHMTEISHFKRPRRAGRGARQGRRPLAGGEPHHVAARGAGGKEGVWGGAGAHRRARDSLTWQLTGRDMRGSE